MKKLFKFAVFAGAASAIAAVVTYKVIEHKKKKAEENTDTVQIDVIIASTDTTSENNCDCTDACTKDCDCECHDTCDCPENCDETCDCECHDKESEKTTVETPVKEEVETKEVTEQVAE